MMWFGEFNSDDKGLYQKVCLWLTDRWDLFLMFKYNWRLNLKGRWAQFRIRRMMKKLHKKHPNL